MTATGVAAMVTPDGVTNGPGAALAVAGTATAAHGSYVGVNAIGDILENSQGFSSKGSGGSPEGSAKSTGAGSQRWSQKTTKDGAPHKKPGPKPDGPHNDKIEEIIQRETDAGNTHVGGGVYRKTPEVTIETRGGVKDTRRTDATFVDRNGNTYHYNVGQSNKRPGAEKGGVDPIKRERDALDDIRGADENIEFEAYD
ncbi:MAG: hypothetical protein AAFX93_19230 [Verrucomicrobiota bacterium]